MSAPIRIRVCRDCCCGSRRKHPHVDHEGLYEALATGTRGHAEVSTSTCLLTCEESNVVVVVPGSGARAGGGRPVWFRAVLSLEVVDRIAAWVRSGGPGVAPVPADLADAVMPTPGLSSMVGSTFGPPS